nr:hypothetical protein [Tanacetum cinerariifolium]
NMANENVLAPAPIRSDDQIFPFAAWANTGIPIKKGKKTKPHVIPYFRFTKLIIYYLGRIHNIHQRSGSSLNLVEDDLSLGNLKFIPKGEIDEVFGMQIPKELITNNIRNAPYYNAYLKMAAKHDKKITAKDGGKKKAASKSRPPPERVLVEEDQARPDPGQSHVALARLDPEPMNDDFVATMYPQNLDAYTFGDQFFNDKPTKEEPDILNMDTKVESMVTISIHQASSSAHPLFTPVIDLIPLKLDQTNRAFASRVFTLELRDLPHKINKTVNEVVKEVVHVALQAPLRDRFRELPEADMKEFLHERMLKSGSYKSLPEHVALYKALEVSIECSKQDAFLTEKDKSRKRRCDDQDRPPPPPDSDLSKKKRHDSDVSGSKHLHLLIPQPGKLLTLVKLRPAPSSKNLEDTDTAHLPKIKTRPDWLKPVPEEDRPKTPKPDWIIPPMIYQKLRTIGPMHLPARIKIQMNTSYYNRVAI